MKRIISKSVLFATAIICLDYCIGSLLSNLFFKTREGDFGGRINLAMERHTEILILGSSRAEHHYVPQVISKITGLSVFNAGMDGQSILYHYCIEQLALNENKPKIIVLEFRPDDLYSTKNDELERLSILLPYKKNAKVNAMLKLRSPFEFLKQLSRIYPYNSKILGILRFSINKRSEGSSERNGYTPLFGTVSDKLINAAKRKSIVIVKEVHTFDPFKVSILKQIIHDAKKINARLLVVESPSWYPEFIRHDEKQIATEWEYIKNEIISTNVELYRCKEEVNIFKEEKYFKDFLHLNDVGAREFSKLIAYKIKMILEENEAI